MKRTRRLTVLLISIVLLITNVTANYEIASMGRENNSELQNEIVTSKNNRKKSEKIRIVKELKKNRTKNSNTYMMSDGSKRIDLYGTDIRFKDNGKWETYDCNIKDTGKETYNKVNAKGDSKHYFPKQLDENTPIKMRKGDYMIEFAPVNVMHNVNTQFKGRENLKLKENSVDKNENTNNLYYIQKYVDNNEITYENQNFKIKYTSLNYGVKEEIILYEKPETREFEFILNTYGLKAVLDKTGRVYLKDKKEYKAYIEAPNIKSGEGNISYKDVSYKLKYDSGKYKLLLKIKDNYFNKNTKYPVVIDPSLVWFQNGLKCNAVNSFFAVSDMVLDGNSQFSVHNKGINRVPYTGTMQRGYINTINLNKDNATAKSDTDFYGTYIDSATLSVKEKQSDFKSGVIELKEPLKVWDSETLTWNNQPQLGETVGSFISTGSEAERHDIDLTRWVQNVANKNGKNNGLVLTAKEEGTGAIIYGPELSSRNYMWLSINYREVEAYDGMLEIEAEYDNESEKVKIFLPDYEDVNSDGVEAEKEKENEIIEKASEQLENEDMSEVVGIESYRVFVRKANEDSFRYLTDCNSSEEVCEIETEEVGDLMDFRVMAVFDDGKIRVSNIETLKKTINDEIVTYETTNVDTDGDGLEDGYEIWDFKTKWNEKDAKGNYILDSDGDGFPDGYEVFTLGTDPVIANAEDKDSDGDGLTDLMEYAKGTDPWLKDTDFDGDSDAAESQPTKTNGCTSKAAAEDAKIHIGKYDIEYSENKEGVIYTYIENLYRGDTKSIYIDYGDNKLNKHLKYFYDKYGNNTTAIESYDDVRTDNHEKTQTICTTYKYDSYNNVEYICDQETKYYMDYDGEGNIIKLDIGSQNLIEIFNSALNEMQTSNTFTKLDNGRVKSKKQKILKYGNGDKIKTITTVYETVDSTPDTVETEILMFYNNDTEKSYEAQYNSDGKILIFKDYTKNSEEPIVYNYEYKEKNVKISRTDGFEKNVTITEDDVKNQTTTTTEYKYKNINNSIVTRKSDLTMDTNDDGKSSRLTNLYNGDVYKYEQNANENAVIKTISSNNNILYSSTEKKTSEINTSYLVNTYQSHKNFEYTFDLSGNIIQINLNNEIIQKYSYDAHGRLEWQIDYRNRKGYKYEYNSTGNILAEWVYPLNQDGEPNKNNGNVKYMTYGYDDNIKEGNTNWPDQLTSYDGQILTYDNSGNPIQYINDMKFVWHRGRLLSEIQLNDKKIVSYKYNENGLRIYKDCKDYETSYEWDQDMLIREKVKYKATNELYDIWYFLDNIGSVTGFEYSYLDDSNKIKKETVYYEKNIQGDVIGLLDSTGEEIANYEYDGWGRIVSSTCKKGKELPYKLNHITYRGYYLDEETKFYYLQSRYYDPEIFRFINADDLKYLGKSDSMIDKNNLYIYCSDNPIMFTDQGGYDYRHIKDFVKSMQKFIYGTKIEYCMQRRPKKDYYKVQIPWSKTGKYVGIFQGKLKMSRYKFYKKMGMPAIRRTQKVTFTKTQRAVLVAAATVVSVLATKNVQGVFKQVAIGYVVGESCNSNIIDAGRYKIVQTVTYTKVCPKPELYDVLITMDLRKKEYTTKNKGVWINYRDRGLNNTIIYQNWTKKDIINMLKRKLSLY